MGYRKPEGFCSIVEKAVGPADFGTFGQFGRLVRDANMSRNTSGKRLGKHWWQVRELGASADAQWADLSKRMPKARL
jgi:hypothetical protein